MRVTVAGRREWASVGRGRSGWEQALGTSSTVSRRRWWAERHTQPRGGLHSPWWRTGGHTRLLLEGERHLQEMWDSTSSSNESLESRPIFLTSAVVAHTLDGHLPAMCCLSPGHQPEEPLVLWTAEASTSTATTPSVAPPPPLISPCDLTFYEICHHTSASPKTPSPFCTC